MTEAEYTIYQGRPGIPDGYGPGDRSLYTHLPLLIRNDYRVPPEVATSLIEGGELHVIEGIFALNGVRAVQLSKRYYCGDGQIQLVGTPADDTPNTTPINNARATEASMGEPQKARAQVVMPARTRRAFGKIIGIPAASAKVSITYQDLTKLP